MKSVLDKTTRAELINRVNSLTDKNSALWGKMTLLQMIGHCKLWDDMIQGRIKSARVFPGRIFGKFVLKQILKDDSPLRKNTPTVKQLIVEGTTGDLSFMKNEWQKNIAAYEGFDNPGFIHPFFGKMTDEQIGTLVYKHASHHLGQFGA